WRAPSVPRVRGHPGRGVRRPRGAHRRRGVAAGRSSLHLSECLLGDLAPCAGLSVADAGQCASEVLVLPLEGPDAVDRGGEVAGELEDRAVTDTCGEVEPAA